MSTDMLIGYYIGLFMGIITSVFYYIYKKITKNEIRKGE